MLCFRVKTEVKEMGKMFVMKKGLPFFPRGKFWNILRTFLRFEWDEEKNQINQKKHKISFETAAYVFVVG